MSGFLSFASPILDFFRPTKVKIALLIIFILVAAAGHIQSYAFVDEERSDIEKPLFYDLLSPFPFWSIWMILIMPLLMLMLLLEFVGPRILAASIWRGPAFWIIQMLYFYYIASLADIAVRNRDSAKRIINKFVFGFFILLILGLVLYFLFILAEILNALLFGAKLYFMYEALLFSSYLFNFSLLLTAIFATATFPLRKVFRLVSGAYCFSVIIGILLFLLMTPLSGPIELWSSKTLPLMLLLSILAIYITLLLLLPSKRWIPYILIFIGAVVLVIIAGASIITLPRTMQNLGPPYFNYLLTMFSAVLLYGFMDILIGIGLWKNSRFFEKIKTLVRAIFIILSIFISFWLLIGLSF